MAVRNSNIQKIDLKKELRSSLQSGSIPSGATGEDKYPLNVSTAVLGNPRDNVGSSMSFPVQEIRSDYSIVIQGNWTTKIRTGYQVQLLRGNIVKPFTVRKIFYDTALDQTVLFFFSGREGTEDISKFLGISSFPDPSLETAILLNRKIENPNEEINLLKDFDVRIIPTTEGDFSAKVSWDISPLVSVSRLRWRPVPNVDVNSVLSFNVDSIGEYLDIPKVTVQSDTGFSAKVRLSGSISQVFLSSGGSGYTFANVIIDGSGTGAVLSANIVSGIIVSIDVLNGGSSYTSKPNIVIQGDGSGAVINSVTMLVDTIHDIEQGGGYLSAPAVIVDDSFQFGLSSTQITSTLQLRNKPKINTIRVIQGGEGYDNGATVSVTGSLAFDDATAVAIIENGAVKRIDLTHPGYDYSNGANVSISPVSSGSGAIAVANVDTFSEWVYEEPVYDLRTKIITGLKSNVLYEVQILVSEDALFRNNLKYSDSITFKLVR